MKAKVDIKSVGSAQGRELCKKTGKIRTIKQTCSKLSAVVALANFQQKRMKQKISRFQSEIGSFESLRSCSQCSVHRKIGAKNVTYGGEREGDQRLEMPTCECECTEIHCTVQRVQPDRVTTVEGGTTRGTTALVY